MIASPFGVSLPNRAVLFGVSVDTLLEVTVRAEASGRIGSVWVGDNFLSQPRIESMVLLSAMAARTERIALGTLCLATLPLRQPLQLAIQWASLDLLSKGRTILGVCNGHSGLEGPYFERELRAMGVRSQDRAPRVEEGILVLRKAWAPGPIEHEGRFYSFRDVDCLPKPVQPSIPILIAVVPGMGGATSGPEAEERIFRRVARLANGWQSGPRSPEVFGQHWRRILEYAEEYGRREEVTRSAIHFRVNIDDDAERARRNATEFTAKYYADTIPAAALQMSDRSLICGPPSMVAERVAAFMDAGCTTPVFGLMSLDQLTQLERLITGVLPLLDRHVTVERPPH